MIHPAPPDPGSYHPESPWHPPPSRVRPPAVAGSFYPADPETLRREVSLLLDPAGPGVPGETAGALPTPSPAPEPSVPFVAAIVPHAGYLYSGPVAATFYRLLRDAVQEPASPARRRERFRRVVLLGPSHRVPVRGLALPDVSGFHTPLGNVPLERQACEHLARLPQVSVADPPHGGEHSLEVQLPFLQQILGDFELVPLVVGDASPEAVAEILRAIWDGPQTLVLVSSDLSHYLPHARARERDRRTADAIEALRWQDVGCGDACGRDALNGLLSWAQGKGWSVETLDLRNSGDVTGPRSQVVGYGSFLVRR